jgi:hypothetical protein
MIDHKPPEMRYDRLAQRGANYTWFFGIVGGVVWWLSSWAWALLPAAAAVFFAIGSVQCTLAAERIRKDQNPLH